MDKTFNPFAIEEKWYEFWETNNFFKPSGKGEPYSIMIPPPNVTGTLHMGHGFQQTLMDALIRYHRMLGYNTLWQVGTDHAGISTQMVVERELAKENKTRVELGREAFVKQVWQWKKQYGALITNQMRRLGISVDWSRERFTLDPQMNKAVQEVFIRLYEQGLIYRGKKLVNWDPHFQTAISDLEVNFVEEEGFLWYIRYPLTDDTNYLTIATTRPETLLGDTAVAVHPDDERYQKFIGKSVKVPLTDRVIPIIADTYVDKEFGTGCLKITPAHDFNDYEVAERHQLPQLNIFTADAKLNENTPTAYRGMDRFQAREQIVNDLKKSGLIIKIEPHKLKAPRADRGNTLIEPYLTNQWFVKVEPLAKQAIEAVENHQIKFIPETWSKTYFQWMRNIQDWCISRQLWWGHRIPAWYDEHGNIYVAVDEATVRQKYQLPSDMPLKQEEDVLDTWFSSALWPFATLGWPETTEPLKTYYPTSVLVTGFDIIFFWVARMIMMGLKFMDREPFKEVYITGLIRDSEGQKMSKTKGNVLDPIDLIDGIDLESLISKRTQGLIHPQLAKHIEKNTRREFPEGIPPSGTDALRFTFCALATTGRDIRFDPNRLEGYRNFCNKIWNATRYVLMNVEDHPFSQSDYEYSLPDRWIQSRLQETIQQVKNTFKNYRFDLLAQAIYDFVWHEFCDWYLELSKPILTMDEYSERQKQGTRKTLITVLETLLRLMHPLMPFITEELWQSIKIHAGKTGKSIMIESFPQVNETYIDKKVATEIASLQKIIMAIRNIRGEMNISPAKKLPLLLRNASDIDRQSINNNLQLLSSLAKLSSITWLEEKEKIPPSATALVGELELLIPLAGLIDKSAEMHRLQKEIEKTERELLRSENKLNNPNYIAKAPAEVVTKERETVKELLSTKNTLQERFEKIKSL